MTSWRSTRTAPNDDAARSAAREARNERFHRMATTMPDGSPVNGFRCWLCGAVEAEGYLIGGRHGLWAEMPGVFDRAKCDRMEQRRAGAE